jgi:hypothetical protein
MLGFLKLFAAPLVDMDAATKKYVDDFITTKLNISGGSVSAPILYAGSPVGATELVNKGYIDGVLGTILASLTGAALNGMMFVGVRSNSFGELIIDYGAGAYDQVTYIDSAFFPITATFAFGATNQLVASF